MTPQSTLWRTQPTLRSPLRARSQVRFAARKAAAPSTAPHWPHTGRVSGTPKYPLSLSLASHGLRADPMTSAKNSVRVRTQIVSPDLCDDVLNYIGPTLEKHKGCDIIDLNPGACLWSQKLHDFLQPRTHILFESTPAFYAEYQQPLLDRPGSRYKLFEGDMRLKEEVDRLFENGLLPDQKPVDPQSPEAQQPNHTLLVTGSLMWDPRAAGMGFNSLGKQLLSLFAQRAWSNEGYHKCGLVRSLFWMTEEDFKATLPRSHYMFPKYAVYMNLVSRSVQVVTPGHGEKGAAQTTIARGPHLEIQSVIRAMQRGREKGMELPERRREDIHDFADEIAQSNIAQGKEIDARVATEDMQDYLEQQQRAGKSTQGLLAESDIATILDNMAREKDPNLDKYIKKPGEAYKGARRTTDEGKKKSARRSVVAQTKRLKIKAAEVADLGEALYALEVKVLKMEDGPEKEAALQELEVMEEKFEEALEKQSRERSTYVMTELNERLSLQSPVPRLEWDNRPYEPLVVEEDEAWPMKRISLVDNEPLARPPGKTATYLDWVLDFVFALYQTPNVSVLQALETLQPGASSLADEVPSLKDPDKGGRLNLKHLKVNMLTIEMVTELFHAYHDWPFKSSQVAHPKYFQLKMRGSIQ